MNAPFQYGTLATKENFVDRVEDRAQLKSFLSSHINVMLISPRRWGKSSLVKVAMEELQNEDKDIRVCFIDAFNNAHSPFYRFGQMLFLDKIAKTEWMPFIMESFEKTGKHISETFASQVCDTVECHSWYLQQLCYFIWNATADEVTEQTFQYGLRQLVNTNSPMFLSDTETLAPSQIEMLRAIKDGVQQLSSVEAKRIYALGNPNTISKNKKVLKEKDIIEERKSELVFVDPVYRLWFSQDY